MEHFGFRIALNPILGLLYPFITGLLTSFFLLDNFLEFFHQNRFFVQPLPKI